MKWDEENSFGHFLMMLLIFSLVTVSLVLISMFLERVSIHFDEKDREELTYIPEGGQFIAILMVTDYKTPEERSAFTCGWISGKCQLLDECCLDKANPLLTTAITTLNGSEYRKEYWTCADFTGEDDCFESGNQTLCFIKYHKSW